jgi:hypothetical protein
VVLLTEHDAFATAGVAAMPITQLDLRRVLSAPNAEAL